MISIFRKYSRIVKIINRIFSMFNTRHLRTIQLLIRVCALSYKLKGIFIYFTHMFVKHAEQLINKYSSDEIDGFGLAVENIIIINIYIHHAYVSEKYNILQVISGKSSCTRKKRILWWWCNQPEKNSYYAALEVLVIIITIFRTAASVPTDSSLWFIFFFIYTHRSHHWLGSTYIKKRSLLLFKQQDSLISLNIKLYKYTRIL